MWMAVATVAAAALSKKGGKSGSQALPNYSQADGFVSSGDWNVATSGSKTGQPPIELLVVGGLVALLIWKKVK